MTGCEISKWLFNNIDFCVYFCGYDCYYIPHPCTVLSFGGECPHEIAHTMFKIAVDMLETA